ncbi:KGG domain-containing protein [Tahibacter amnicola]|uniref:KGG domain-containing protein n=1 Tax=Tahibacter amnicola TaxID=2976241 RepID=UPI003CCDD723
MATNQGTPGNTRKGEGRGFASMDAEKQREIASKGGRAAHESGNAHEFTSEEARIAGRKGGEVVSQDREHMAEIGRRGGEARSRNQNATDEDGNRRGDVSTSTTARNEQRGPGSIDDESRQPGTSRGGFNRNDENL